jgi:hypothetical protein
MSKQSAMLKFVLLVALTPILFSSQRALASKASCPVPHAGLTDDVADLQSTVKSCATTLSSDAASLRTELVNAGFSCGSGKVASSGIRCRGQVDDYSRPVNIFIPAGFQKDKEFTLAFHFTGFTNSPAFNPFTKTNGDYGRYLTQSKKNALMIIPESTGTDSTYSSELNTPTKMNRFFANITDILKTAGVRTNRETPIVLSGHSGAAVQLARMGNWAASGQVPLLKNVRGIGLFDSVFTSHIAGLTKYEAVMKQNGTAKFFSAYNPGGTNGVHNRALKQSLGSGSDLDAKFIANHSIEHMAFMKNYMTRFLDDTVPTE